MRILLCGNDEARLVSLALKLTGASSDLSVEVLLAGTATTEFRVASRTVSEVPIHCAERSDLHPGHWHKSASVSVRETLRSLLEGGRFDLVHVLTWRGLTRDIVATAKALGVPAVVSLEDDWANCLLSERVQPSDAAAEKPCALRHSVVACLPCARSGEPQTAWVPIEAEFITFAERAGAVNAEFKLAAAIFADSQASLDRHRRLGEALIDREVLIAPNSDSSVLLEAYERVVTAQEEPGNEAKEPVWYEERMQRFAEEEWDKNCREAEA